MTNPIKVLILGDKKINEDLNIHVECPVCDNWEQQPIDQQRHHLQCFEIIEHRGIKEVGDIELSDIKCLDCNSDFVIEWDYNNFIGVSNSGA
jgi:hypothetical protein